MKNNLFNKFMYILVNNIQLISIVSCISILFSLILSTNIIFNRLDNIDITINSLKNSKINTHLILDKNFTISLHELDSTIKDTK